MKRFDKIAESLELVCNRLLDKEDWENHSECERIKTEMISSHAILVNYGAVIDSLMDEMNGEVQQKQD